MTAKRPDPAAQRSVFRRKPVEAFVTETRPDAEGGELERSIGLFQLTLFGVGATIGTGIFIVLTEAVPEAGPAVLRSEERRVGKEWSYRLRPGGCQAQGRSMNQ